MWKCYADCLRGVQFTESFCTWSWHFSWSLTWRLEPLCWLVWDVSSNIVCRRVLELYLQSVQNSEVVENKITTKIHNIQRQSQVRCMVNTTAVSIFCIGAQQKIQATSFHCSISFDVSVRNVTVKSVSDIYLSGIGRCRKCSSFSVASISAFGVFLVFFFTWSVFFNRFSTRWIWRDFFQLQTLWVSFGTDLWSKVLSERCSFHSKCGVFQCFVSIFVKISFGLNIVFVPFNAFTNLKSVYFIKSPQI